MYSVYLIFFKHSFFFSFYVFLCHSATWHVTAKVKAPLLFAWHLVPVHNHPEWAVITPPQKRDTCLYWEWWTKRWLKPQASAPASLCGGERDFAFSTHGVPRSQATGFSERRYQSLSYQVKQLPPIARANKEAPKYLQVETSLSDSQNNYQSHLNKKEKKKRNLHFSLTQCNVITSYVAPAEC